MGEKRGFREAMVRLQGRMVSSGMDPRLAAQRARSTAISRDRASRDGTDKQQKKDSSRG